MYPDSILLQAIDHCCKAFPGEGCGVILRAKDGTLTARPMANVIDRYHARDPVRFPRTAATAYLFDPREQMAVFEQAERDGGQVICIFHSHADHDAYFSAEDHANALVDGRPLLPGVEYLVISVRSGVEKDLRRYVWDGSRFAESVLPLPKRP